VTAADYIRALIARAERALAEEEGKSYRMGYRLRVASLGARIGGLEDALAALERETDETEAGYVDADDPYDPRD